MEYIKLIKLLYFLDRATLLKWGRPVTTDRYVSMANGPVVRRIYDLISEPPAPDADKIWHRFISPPSRYFVRLLKDPGANELSKAEEQMIAAVFKKFGGRTWQQLVRFSHKSLKEWHDPEDRGVTEITISDILRAGGTSEEDIAAIEGELESLAVVQRMLSE